ncbi:MAG: MBOAT family protein [Clostridia bacterium]|nr:MBOAT family protein [Clostridia bacterium]
MGKLTWILQGVLPNLSSFTSFQSVIYLLPIFVFLYAITPKKAKKYYLLIASYVFYFLVNGGMLIYLLVSTFLMHYFAIWIERLKGQMNETLKQTEKEEKKAVKKKYVRYQRGVLVLAVLIHIGALVVLKYTGFFITNINRIIAATGSSTVIAIPKFLVPLGISFFSLQALSYILDVYRGITKADDNIMRLALFLGFFPQIVEGPICRYNQTAEQLWNAKPVTSENLTFGLQRILFGMIKKIVIADRLNQLVGVIFAGYAGLDGGTIALGAIFYTIQLYMDFSGVMDIVIGLAQIIGVQFPENFERPFFSKTISEFWKRWHITLGTWFRDYIFYPVTTSGSMKKLTASARKKLGNHYGPLIAGSIALFSVWICNGLWHGADWNYIFFGMYHFALILLGNLIVPIVRVVNKKLNLNPENFFYHAMQVVRTSILVVIGELFFRAEGLTNGFHMFGKIFTDFSFSSMNADLLVQGGIDYLDFIIIGITLLGVFVVSILNEKKISVRELQTRPAKGALVLQWSVIFVLAMFLVIFGAYGVGYAEVHPMYAQF